jgi:ribosome-binding protein aMBF1 (putative translation factor)
VQGFAWAGRILTADNRLQPAWEPAVSESRSSIDALRAFGQAVSELRAERGMSVSELAAAARTTSRRITRLEAGLIDPRYDLLVALVKAFDVRPSLLIGRAEELERRMKGARADR